MNTTAQQPDAAPSASQFRPDPHLPGVTFAGSFRAEFAKLRALRTTWWLSGSSVVTAVLIATLMALSVEYLGPSAPEAVPTLGAATLASQSMAGTYFAMIMLGSLGVIAITTEFSTGAIRSSLTAVPRRSLLVGSKLLALAAWTGLVTAVLVVLCHLVVALIAEPLALTDMVTNTEIGLVYLTSWAAVVITTIMGFGLGTLLRSSAGAIVVLAVILFVLQIVLSIIWSITEQAAWVEALMRIEYMFLLSELSSVTDQPASFGPEPLQRWQAGLGMLIWAAVPTVAGWLSFLRRDS